MELKYVSKNIAVTAPGLLIVLNGIEIKQNPENDGKAKAFNRTKWN